MSRRIPLSEVPSVPSAIESIGADGRSLLARIKGVLYRWTFASSTAKDPILFEQFMENGGREDWIVLYEAASCDDVSRASHTPTGFATALMLLKEGRRVARTGWNGKGMWLTCVNAVGIFTHAALPIAADVRLAPWIGMKTADNKFVPWLASQTDLLAEDWIEAPDPKPDSA